MDKKMCIIFFILCALFNQDNFTAAQSGVCLEPMETGRCRGYFTRYGYSATEGKCVEFIYGGCQGNENNFHTLSACENACKPASR